MIENKIEDEYNLLEYLALLYSKQTFYSFSISKI